MPKLRLARCAVQLQKPEPKIVTKLWDDDLEVNF